MRDIRGSVTVITGATSGIGHATALEFARRGCKLVLAARSASALDIVAREIGGDVIVVPADVASFDDVERIAVSAEQAFGRLDIWINNAAVGEWSTIEEMPVEDIHRIIDVALFGTIHGIKAALPRFRRQGGGTLINVTSALADRSVPLQSAYCAAKAGVRAYTEALRLELNATNANVDVVQVLPASINTPFYTWGPSRLGVRPRPISVVYSPEKVARAIVRAAQRPRRDVYVGLMAKLLSLGQRVSPVLMDAYMLQGGRMFREQYTVDPDRGENNLYHSPGETQIRGACGASTTRMFFARRARRDHP